uniref:Transcriptional regulator n=1 Tax=Heterorhabditis bacteriophora TaxID=37862 RepID=A0A1I7W8S7_HETBA
MIMVDRASTLRIYEIGQIKALSTAGYTVKQISDTPKQSLAFARVCSQQANGAGTDIDVSFFLFHSNC